MIDMLSSWRRLAFDPGPEMVRKVTFGRRTVTIVWPGQGSGDPPLPVLADCVLRLFHDIPERLSWR